MNMQSGSRKKLVKCGPEGYGWFNCMQTTLSKNVFTSLTLTPYSNFWCQKSNNLLKHSNTLYIWPRYEMDPSLPCPQDIQLTDHTRILLQGHVQTQSSSFRIMTSLTMKCENRRCDDLPTPMRATTEDIASLRWCHALAFSKALPDFSPSALVFQYKLQNNHSQ